MPKDVGTIVSRLVLERKHKALLAQFREIDKSLRSLPASASYFVPPTPLEISAMVLLRDRGMLCRHNRFNFESCPHCGRKAKKIV
jgi:hypothetical protein